MKYLYKTVVFEMSLFYAVLAIVLPLIYAATYQLSFASVFNLEWFAVTLFMYPLVLILSMIRYSYYRVKKDKLIAK